tara:strand:- start:466 stop:888 length:423 start_codon:yes stop_codon:yes gene_type:complete
MIKYNLKCYNNHEFESWFSNSEEFDKLKKKKLLECIYCSSKEISKSIMAPMVSGIKAESNKQNKSRKNLSFYKKELHKIREFVEKNFEFVGDKLSQKVREIYYDKKTKKSIYGTATPKERKELAEEGIELSSIPWINKDN